MTAVLLVIFFAIGVLSFGVFLLLAVSGTVEVDLNDPNTPYLRLKLTDEELKDLTKKKRKWVLFRVDTSADFTRQKHSVL